MTDFAPISTTDDDVLEIITKLNERIVALEQMLAGDHTNLANGAVKWNDSQRRFEKYNGSGFDPLAQQYAIDVSLLRGYAPTTGSTANSIALRDSSGRVSVGAPGNDFHAVRRRDLTDHTQATGNVHGMTKGDLGLNNVDNVQQLQRSSNLADVPNKSSARDNLGLGSAASRNTGTQNGRLVLWEDVPQTPNATTATAGRARFGTANEHQNGASGVAATPAGVRQMGYLKASEFESGEIALNAASDTYAGYAPNQLFGMQVWLRCKTAEMGWSVGQTVPVTAWVDSGRAYGAQPYQSGNYVYVLQGATSLPVINQSSFAVISVTPGNWRLFVRGLMIG